MTVEKIKSLLKTGDVSAAETAAQELLATEPDNVQAMMLYGTCRQLQGDEATFHDTYATVKAALDAGKVKLETVMAEEWRWFEMFYKQFDQPELLRKCDWPRSPGLMECVILVILIVAAVIGVWISFGDQFGDLFKVDAHSVTIQNNRPVDNRQLYACPRMKDIKHGRVANDNERSAEL